MSRLTIEVTEQQHQNIKALAALQGKSIKEYALQRLFAATPDEEHAMQELKTLLASRIAEGTRGEVSDQSITEIADEVLQSGGRV
jgi:phosphotransferase system HPr-like phosphotransfer protein